MREIEKEIIREIHFGHKYIMGKNFSIRDRLERDGYNEYKIFLWDSLIFFHSAKTNKSYFSFNGYATHTTLSRINAYIASLSPIPTGRIFKRDYQLYFKADKDSKAIKVASSSWYEIEKNATIEEIANILAVM